MQLQQVVVSSLTVEYAVVLRPLLPVARVHRSHLLEAEHPCEKPEMSPKVDRHRSPSTQLEIHSESRRKDSGDRNTNPSVHLVHHAIELFRDDVEIARLAFPDRKADFSRLQYPADTDYL